MGRSKELWMDAVEAEAMRLVDDGMDEEEAWEQATNAGDDLLADKLGDMMDRARDMHRDGLL